MNTNTLHFPVAPLRQQLEATVDELPWSNGLPALSPRWRQEMERLGPVKALTSVFRRSFRKVDGEQIAPSDDADVSSPW